jgi:hypothetical protein
MAAEPSEFEIEIQPGPTVDDPYEVRRYDPASGEWSGWVEQGEFFKRIRGESGHRETVKHINELVKEDRENVAHKTSAPPHGDDPTLMEKRDNLKEYLAAHPGTRLMDLEMFHDAERGPLSQLAKKLQARGELIEHPQTKALSFPGQGPVMVKGPPPTQEEENDTPKEVRVRVLKDMKIADIERGSRELRQGELVTLPDSTAKALIIKNIAEEVSTPDPTPENVPAASMVIEERKELDVISSRFDHPDDRFIMVAGRGKMPIGGTDGYQKPGSPNNHARDAPRLAEHITNGGNYGVMCGAGFGRLVGVDADKPVIREAVERRLPKTLAGRTGREDGEGRQYFYRVKDPENLKKTEPLCLYEDGKKVLDEKGKPINVGHIKWTGGYLVGPGSTHPSGNKYRIIEDLPIAEVFAADLLLAFDEWLPPPTPGDRYKEVRGSHPNQDFAWLDNLRIEAVLDISQFKGSRQGWVRGPNPWHDSTTGTNLAVNVGENLAFCHRCEKTIWPLTAVALNAGIIHDCSDRLFGENFWKAVDIAVEKYGLVRPPRPEKNGELNDDHPMWRYTVNPSKKIPLNQLHRWPDCFALIGLKCSVPLETCEAELLAALERSGASPDEVKKALEVVQKHYGKYAPGEDKINKTVRDNIKGCGLMVSEDFLDGWPMRFNREKAEKDEDRSSAARRLLEMARQGGRAEYFHDRTNRPLARVEVRGHHEIKEVIEGDFGSWLTRLAVDADGLAPPKEARDRVVETLASDAVEGEEHPVFIRRGEHEGAFYYDLCNKEWQAVCTSKDGWNVVDDPPARFLRYGHMLPQAVPVGGKKGNLDKMVAYANVSADHRKVMKIHTIVSFVHGIFQYGGLTTGLPGSTKSTLQMILLALVDPATDWSVGLPKDENSADNHLSTHCVSSFDNISKLTGDQSDLLARGETGGGSSRRILYTNNGVNRRSYVAQVFLNAISLEGAKPDFLQRVIVYNTIDRLAKPRGQKAIMRELQELAPWALGEIFDILSEAMRYRDQFNEDDLGWTPRFADWYLWALAVAKAMGEPAGWLERVLKPMMDDRDYDAVADAPVPMALEYLAQNGGFVGTATELLHRLNDPEMGIPYKLHIDTRDRESWPNKPEGLGKKISNCTAALMTHGVYMYKRKYGQIKDLRYNILSWLDWSQAGVTVRYTDSSKLHIISDKPLNLPEPAEGDGK